MILTVKEQQQQRAFLRREEQKKRAEQRAHDKRKLQRKREKAKERQKKRPKREHLELAAGAPEPEEESSSSSSHSSEEENSELEEIHPRSPPPTPPPAPRPKGPAAAHKSPKEGAKALKTLRQTTLEAVLPPATGTDVSGKSTSSGQPPATPAERKKLASMSTGSQQLRIRQLSETIPRTVPEEEDPAPFPTSPQRQP